METLRRVQLDAGVVVVSAVLAGASPQESNPAEVVDPRPKVVYKERVFEAFKVHEKVHAT